MSRQRFSVARLIESSRRVRYVLKKACEERNGEACARLAALYDKGAGVDRAPERAKSLRRQACEYGYADACPQRPEKTS